MPDSFVLPTATVSPAPAQSTQAELRLIDVARQQQDAIVFEGAQVPGLAGAAEAFLIFYLTEEDEQNGFGTVIQLDPATKQAAIFADLNPEYAYLFFNSEQGQLQTLLWCIEFATRTPDGLYVTQAKIHGQGLTDADLQRLNQTPMPGTAPQPEHSLSEAEPLPQPTQAAPQPSAPTFGPPSVAQTPVNVAPETPAESNVQLPPLPELPPLPATPVAAPVAPARQTVVTPTPAAPLAQPDLLAETAPIAPPMPEPQPDWNQPRPVAAPQPLPAEDDLNTLMMDQPAAPVAAATPPAADVLNLDPLPPLPNMPVQPGPSPAQPAPQLKPLMPQAPTVDPNKQPVGRPPKPLTADQAWMIEPQDFNWLKQISREPLEAHKDELRQKIIKQIRKNRPGLVDDWQFHGAFEQAFQAVAQTYDLVPALRHDLLKSLLNGKVVDQVVLQQQAQV